MAGRLVKILQQDNVSSIALTPCADTGIEGTTAQEQEVIAAALKVADSHLKIAPVDTHANARNGKEIDCHSMWESKRYRESFTKAMHFDAIAITTVKSEEGKLRLFVEVYSKAGEKLEEDSAEILWETGSTDEPAPTPAPEPQIDGLASQMVNAITHAKAMTVVVFDFIGPGNKMTPLGQKLADDFSAALAKSNNSFRVEDRSRVSWELQKDPFAPVILRDPDAAVSLGLDFYADAVVVGSWSTNADEINVSARALLAKRAKGNAGFESSQLFESPWTVLPFTGTMRGLDATLETADIEKFPESGKNGYSQLSCIQCPAARFSKEAIATKTQGTVQILVVVGEDGKASDLKVLKGLPDGLTIRAIEAVRSWDFKPATGPDGKPAAVRQLVEVKFNLFK